MNLKVIVFLFFLSPSFMLGQCLDDSSITFDPNGIIKLQYGDDPIKSFQLVPDGSGFQIENDKLFTWTTDSENYFYLHFGNLNYQIDLETNPYNAQAFIQSEAQYLIRIVDRPRIIRADDSSYSIAVCLKGIIESKINRWQKKGEFEKTAEYIARVTKANRLSKIQELQNRAIDSLKNYFLINYWEPADKKLGLYDADNETFLIETPYGSFVLPVPIDRAQEFKQSFEDYIFRETKFIVVDDKFILSHVTALKKVDEQWWQSTTSSLANGRDVFVYDLQNSQDYANTSINYKFAEIELPEINSSTKTPTQIGSNNIRVGSSEVDLNIPTNTKVDNRYAIVIGNEDYLSYQKSLNAEQNVDYAVNDAKVFKEYCLKTFGVKEENLDLITNATAGAMNQKFNKVIKLMEKIGPQAELIVYYAGHGFPDEITKEPYLVPVDVSGTDLSAAIKLEDLYRDLGNTGAKVTVFLDACFTGGGRNSGLIAARGVRVKPQDEILNGNLVVLSASSGDQSALPYHQEGHGMFTYYLLEKLQNDRGYMTLGQLADYINRNVSITSLKVNEKEQDPVVNTSEKVAGSWRNWTF